MTFDEALAERIRSLVGLEYGISERRMFGGVAFLLHGHMAVAASSHGGIMVRVPPEDADDVLALPHTSPMVMSGRETRGWIRVTAAGCESDEDLH
ncbi:MAG: TfoX family protein, partial [Actinomycetales bacterium]